MGALYAFENFAFLGFSDEVRYVEHAIWWTRDAVAGVHDG